MVYKIKEIFYSLQGEGVQSGRPSVFCRFSGCNLWSGREKDRKSSVCRFCDTDIWGTDGENGGTYQSEKLAERILSFWPQEEGVFRGNPYVVLTGGEPALQLDQMLIKELHDLGFEIGIETNGTVGLPPEIDWICVSPKAETKIKVKKGNEIKVVFPQDNLNPSQYESLDFEHFLIQPLDSPDYKNNLGRSVDYCLQNPLWKLSLQIHKYIGIS